MSDTTRYEVVVAGGGMAGVGAACMAAAGGARTLLVERLEVLGGLGAAGGVGSFCFGEPSLPEGQGPVFDAVWEGLLAYGAIGEANGWPPRHGPPFFNYPFDHAVLPFVLQELADKAGVETLFATDVIGAEAADGRVAAIRTHNRSLVQRVEAAVFIDCTGDGVLARHAGAKALPPEDDHPGSIPPGHMVFLQRAGAPRPQVVRREEPGLPPPRYSVWPEPDRTGLKMQWPEGGFDTSTGGGYSEAGKAFRRRIPEYVRHFQSTAAGRDQVFAFSAPMFGQRDGIRVEGDHVLTAEDLLAGRRFADAVAHGCFPFDSAAFRLTATPPYQIPYRSLLARGLENVLVAGRCLSATRVALSSARPMATCCLTGQAAGVAAALACRRAVPPRQVEAGAIRACLAAQGGTGARLAARLS